MAEIVFDGVTKRYPGGQEAVRKLDIAIADGEFLVLVGPSGCGKSTALRMVAGLEDITEGRILIGGEVANDLAPRERNIAMIFQTYALYPHLTVAENIGFGLRVRGMAKEEIAAKVRETAESLELGPLLKRKPAQLSGGQRQRVAMGRAIVRAPKAFLMDEPLSNLDARLRVQLRAEIARIQKMSGDHHHLRHPRPGRGDDDGRPRGGDGSRRAAADRHAARALSRAGEPLRRGLHRLAGDEPARRPACGGRGRAGADPRRSPRSRFRRVWLLASRGWPASSTATSWSASGWRR